MKIYELHEISDSAMQYKKNPPNFLIWLIFVFLLIIITALIWANYSIKDSVVTAQFTVTTEDKTTIMIPSVGGKITDLNINEGKEVIEGDVLFSVDDSSITNQIATLENQIIYLKTFVDGYNSFATSLNDLSLDNLDNAINPYYSENDSEYYFYVLYESVLESIKSTVKNYDVETSEEEKLANYKSTINQYVTTYIQQKTQYEYELVGIQGQKQAYEKNLEQYTVKAEVSGKIHMSGNINVGTVLSGGTLIGYIVQNVTKENVIIEAFIPINQRVFVNTGNEVDLAIYGVLQANYGVMKGKVLSIALDNTVSSDGDTAFYKAIIKPNETNIRDKKGNAIELSTGLMGEARIIYSNMTWLQWISKQIGVMK